MNCTRIILTIISFSVLSACSPSKQEYEVIQETVRGSAKARTLAMSECMKNWDSTSRRNAAIMIDTSEKNAPRLVCSRVVEAVRSGKMNYQDAVDIKRRNFTPKLIKIIQGR